MKWLKWIWGGIALVFSVVVAVVTMKYLRKPAESREDREAKLADSVARAELEAAEKVAEITARTDADLAEIEAKRWREEKKIDEESAAQRKDFNARLTASYEEMDDEETRAHLRSLLDDGGSPTNDD